MIINSPTGGIDHLGQLGVNLSYDLTLLNAYLPLGLIHGYSVSRKLIGSASAAFRVRRSSDNNEQDIGFVNKLVDTASLLTFVGANDGFVTDIYDQVGSNDISQTTAANQWRIVNAGTLETIESLPVIRRLSTQSTAANYLVTSDINLTNMTILGVYSSSITTGFIDLILSTDNTDTNGHFVSGGLSRPSLKVNNSTFQGTGPTFVINEFTCQMVTMNDLGNVNHWINNTASGTGSVTANTFNIQQIFESNSEKFASEVLIFDRVLAESDRNNLNENANDFYTI